MSLEQDVAAARGAIDALERACAAVTGHFRDTVDSTTDMTIDQAMDSPGRRVR